MPHNTIEYPHTHPIQEIWVGRERERGGGEGRERERGGGEGRERERRGGREGGGGKVKEYSQ